MSESYFQFVFLFHFYLFTIVIQSVSKSCVKGHNEKTQPQNYLIIRFFKMYLSPIPISAKYSNHLPLFTAFPSNYDVN